MSSTRRTLVSFLALVLVACFAPSFAAAAPGRSLDGAISGLVLDRAGKPVKAVEVQVWQRVWHGYNEADWEMYLSGLTGRTGTYKITAPPGSYRVWFRPADLRTYCMEAYPNAAIPDTGDDVVVRAGRTTSRISVTLDDNCGWIEGTVYDASQGDATNAGLPGVPVQLAIQQVAIINAGFGTTTTDQAGHYRFDGLKPWMWGIWVNFQRSDPRYIELDLLDFEWTGYGSAKVVNADLEPVGFVSVKGRLVGQDPNGPGMVPLPGLVVGPYLFEEWEGQWFEDPDRRATTDGNGRFEMANLPAGQYMFFEYGDMYYWERFFNGWDQAGEIVTVERGHQTDLGDWEAPLRNP